MLQILLCWIYILVTSLVLGESSSRFLGRLLKAGTAELHPVILSVTGLLVLMSGLGFYSLWFPIGLAAHIVVLGIVAAILLYTRGRCFRVLRSVKLFRIQQVVLAAISFLLLYKTSQAITTLDTGHYHLPFIRWIEEYKVIPGLANISTRFGFNYQYHILCAFYGFSFLDGNTIHALNGYIQCAVLVYLFSTVRSFAAGRPEPMDIARCLVALMVLCMSNASSSLSPDFPVSGICILLFFVFFDKVASGTLYRWDMEALVVCLLSLTAVLFKLSAVPVVLCSLLYCIVLLRERQYRTIGLLALCCIIGAAPYLLRNYYISGYLIYPLYSLDLFQPDWKLPLQKVIFEKEFIRTWALGIPYGQEIPGLKETTLSWFRVLKLANTIYMYIIAALGICLVLNMAWLLYRAFKTPALLKYWGPGFLVLYISLAYWLRNAPDPRFGNGYILPFMGLTIAWYICALPGTAIRRLSLYGSCILALLVAGLQMKGKSAGTVAHNFHRPEQWYLLRQAPYDSSVTRIVLLDGRIPAYQPDSNACWQAPLPCLNCRDSFRLRGTTIAEGFKPL